MWKWMVVLCLALSTTLSAEVKILAFSGSSREDSANKKLVTEVAEKARQMGAIVKVVALKDYASPFYDMDFETKEGMPEKAKKFRQLMIESEVIVIASPEYNGSVSALLKNTIDWASRSENGGSSRDAFKGKKFIIMSASPGASGGARGLIHLRAILENIGGTVISQDIVLPDAYSAFDDHGHLKNEKVKKQIEELLQELLK